MTKKPIFTFITVPALMGFVLCFSESSLGGEMSVVPDRKIFPLMDLQANQSSPFLTIRVHHTCHPGNLRLYDDDNKLARFADLKLTMSVALPSTAEAKNFTLTYPSAIAVKKGIANRTYLDLKSIIPNGLPAGSDAFLEKNSLEIRIPVENNLLSEIKKKEKNVGVRVTEIFQHIREVSTCDENETYEAAVSKKPKKENFKNQNAYLMALESYKAHLTYCFAHNSPYCWDDKNGNHYLGGTGEKITKKGDTLYLTLEVPAIRFTWENDSPQFFPQTSGEKVAVTKVSYGEKWIPRSENAGHLGTEGILVKNPEEKKKKGSTEHSDGWDIDVGVENVLRRVSTRGTITTLYYSFLGEDGLCGSFYSPLMLFFDDNYPKFSGKSFFLNERTHGGSTYWPEPNSKGYFLFLDKNKNGRADDPNELFGDNVSANGFEELAKYDINKDKVIDAKDPIFNELKLWYDKNGDGISQAKEMMSLSEMGIKSISLDYDKNATSGFGGRAEARQKAFFTFKNKAGKLKKGTVLDVYFGNQ